MLILVSGFYSHVSATHWNDVKRTYLYAPDGIRSGDRREIENSPCTLRVIRGRGLRGSGGGGPDKSRSILFFCIDDRIPDMAGFKDIPTLYSYGGFPRDHIQQYQERISRRNNLKAQSNEYIVGYTERVFYD